MDVLRISDLKVGVTYMDVISDQKVLVVSSKNGEAKGKSLNIITGEYPLRIIYEGQLKEITVKDKV